MYLYVYIYIFFLSFVHTKIFRWSDIPNSKRKTKTIIFLNARVINFGKSKSPLGTCFEKLKWVAKPP